MDQRFTVFVRDESRLPDASEIPVAEFQCYGEARRLRRELGQAGRQCVIRSTGQTGGSE
jgi:hypothetical protein